ncbi:2-isopropylmalate synthase [Buchnera aphidicola]|uniref:2-isopropylmalate synthase n=1 Tax=Buchnera aphidicola TaxID=9 RepID=UPI0030EB55FC
MKEKIIIFDTTLRDGEQSLKFSLSAKKKLKIALLLEKMNIDIIEAGFPISSPEDFKAVQLISNIIKKSTICSLSRCIKKDIKIAAKAMKNSENFRIHLFLGTSNLHIKSKLKKNYLEIIEMMKSSIKYAKKYTENIEFSCEDAGRTNIFNLYKFIEIAINSGANTINIPDTVGFTCPSEFKKIIKNIKNNVPNIDKAIISAHCHNDLNMAVGNSISAIEAGARQIEGTITGIGERSGNTSLEDIITIIKIKKKIFHSLYTKIKCKNIYKTSKKISKICKFKIPINKSIIGKNSFCHSSGIHQDGILKNRENYEIINPNLIGRKKNTLNLTSRSGRAAVKYKMKKMGYSLKDYDLNTLYKNFLKFADKKGEVLNYHLEELAFMKNQKLNIKILKLHDLKIKIKLNKKILIRLKVIFKKKIKKLYLKKNFFILKKIFLFFKKLTKIKCTLIKNKIKNINKNNKIFYICKIFLNYKNQKFYGKSKTLEFYQSYILSLIKSFNKIYKSIKISKKISEKIFKK